MPAPLMFAECNVQEGGQGMQKIYNIDVPLGVIRLDHKVAAAGRSTDFTVIVEMAEGGYKGVHSENVLEGIGQTWAASKKGGKTTKRLS